MKHRLQRLAQALAGWLPGGRRRLERRCPCPPEQPGFDFDALARAELQVRPPSAEVLIRIRSLFDVRSHWV